MKVVLLTLACLGLASAAEHCYNDVSLECGTTTDNLVLKGCNAVYGGYGQHGALSSELQAYANLHIERSFEYLLSASYFNNYQTNRKGFSDLFKKLSDDAWSKSIDLIKHVTKRGGTMDFSRRSGQETNNTRSYTVEVNELEALAKALDTQKELAERAFYIHHEASRNNQRLHHDPEIAHYLEEEYIESHAGTIRGLAGHTADLKKFMTANGGQDLSLALYLFDEYLQKSA